MAKTAMQILKKVRLYRLDWQRWSTKAEYIRARCEGGGGLPEVQTGKVSSFNNSVEFRLCELADAEDAAALALRKYRQAEREAAALIDLLEDEADRQILRLKYLDFLPVEKIAEAVGYSDRQTWRKLKAALRELQAIKKPGR